MRCSRSAKLTNLWLLGTFLGVGLVLSTGELAAVPPRILSFTVDDTELPLDGQPWLSWETVGADTLTLSPGIGDVTAFTDETGAGNGVPPSPVTKHRFVDLGEDWIYLDDGSELEGDDWKSRNFNDNSWLIGPGPLGYGDASATALEFGPDVDDKYITYYFRKEFEASQARIDETDVLYLELQRDDGAVVYLNGQEIIRDNLPPGEVDALTLADLATASDSELQIFRYVVDKSLLVPGANILSAEVHQVSPSSSDLIFDAGLFSVRATTPVSMVEFNSQWSYLDDGSDLTDSDWQSPGFDDSTWQSGTAEFGYDSTIEATTLSFGGDPSNKHVTYYFRKSFQVDSPAGVRDLIANLLYDDGAVVYINGSEVARLNLPEDGAIEFDTLALEASTEGIYEELDLSQGIDFLTVGENTLAVEIHQADPASSDISFDMDLILENAVGTEIPVIERHSLWKYDDTGSDLGSSNQDSENAWFAPQFDDSQWASGLAELGYGDSDGTGGFRTTLQYGPDPANKPITTYFRTMFDTTADVLEDLESLTLTLLRDDGAIVYLNGEEVVRDNIAEGDIDAFTPALEPSATTTNWSIDKGAVNVGANTLAVELHQSSASSSDVFLDLRLVGVQPSSSTTYKLTATNEDGSTTAEVTVNHLAPVEGSPLPLDPVFLVTSQPNGTDWEFAATWSNETLPVAEQDYIVHGNFASTVRSPIGVAHPDFAGNLILSGPRSRLVMAHEGGTTARIPTLTMREGAVWHSLDNSYLQVGNSGSTIIVEEAAEFTHASVDGRRVLAVGSNLSGDGTITVTAADFDGSTATLFLGDGSEFVGDWIILDTVSAVGRNALGSGNITLDGNGALDFDYDYHNPDATLEIIGTGTQLVVDRLISVGSLIIRGLDLPEGIYEGVAIEALGDNFVDRGGSIVVGGPDPDTDDDGLIDDWERDQFDGSLAETGDGDFDRDGATNSQEQIAGTNAADPASVFRLDAIPGDSGLLLEWQGNSRRSYFVQVSEDLETWSVVGVVPGTDGITMFVDDLNFPPAAGDLRLFYRVVVSGS